MLSFLVHAAAFQGSYRPFLATKTTRAISSTIAKMSSEAEKESKVECYPADYVVPKVWTFEEQGGVMGGMNRPTAGARHEKKLPKGEHELQLYSLGTPNGMKVTMLLEELNDLKGIEYDAWKVSIFENEQFGSEFVGVNPNSKIPCMLDTSFDPPLRVFESGAMLKYIAEKYDNAFIPSDPRKRAECFNWLFWQMGSAPYIRGGFGHFYRYAPLKIQYAIDCFTMETKRQLDILDQHLADNKYMGSSDDDDILIADFAIWPWILCCAKFYGAEEFLEIESYTNLNRWMKLIGERPGVQCGIHVNGFVDKAIDECHSRDNFDLLDNWVFQS